MTEKPEIVGIQYLRGIAALAVVVDHTSGMAAFDKYFGVTLFDGFLTHGARGVDLFFLISGFIICMIGLDGANLRPSLELTDFVSRRFVRIVPLMWLAIVSYAVLRLLGRGTLAWGGYTRAFFLVPFWNVEPNQIWTLRHEMIFYLLFAASFLYGRRKPWIIGVWATAPLAYAAFNMPESPSDLFRSFLWIAGNPVNLEFASGVALGVVWHKSSKAFSFGLPIPPMILFLAAMLALMGLSYAIGSHANTLTATICVCAFCIPILFAGVHIRCNRDWLGSVGDFLGAASYAIYLFHPHFVSAILGVWSKLHHGTPIALVIAGTTVLAVIACAIVHVAIERPLLRLSRSLLKKALSPQTPLPVAP